jgi:hypothetical protein
MCETSGEERHNDYEYWAGKKYWREAVVAYFKALSQNLPRYVKAKLQENWVWILRLVVEVSNWNPPEYESEEHTLKECWRFAQTLQVSTGTGPQSSPHSFTFLFYLIHKHQLRKFGNKHW